MRLSLPSLAASLLMLGCASNSATPVGVPAAQDSGEVLPAADDGSTAGCTSLGGTCVPYSDNTCPEPQQNPTLCENVILLCCLPASPDEDGGPVTEPEGGEPDDAMESTDDASPAVDAGMPTSDASPAVDAGMPTSDASSAVDASMSASDASPSADATTE